MFMYAVLFTMAAVSFYIRYIPVAKVRCLEEIVQESSSMEVLDVRDYNLSYRNPVPGSLNIPVAYLKRHLHELPKTNIVVAASTVLEKNLSIRLLRIRGYKVIGYTYTDCSCREEKKAG
ncbi:MAG TPA: hypothetical protein VIG80_15455 [Bacillaceae bacterium]